MLCRDKSIIALIIGQYMKYRPRKRPRETSVFYSFYISYIDLFNRAIIDTYKLRGRRTKFIYTQQQGCQFHNTKSFSPIFISRYMGMSKNENEARIYTGGRESARIFLRASSSHYTTIRMYAAVEKCRKQQM